MSPYARAADLLRRNRYDPAAVFDWFYAHGYVYADQECLILAEWLKRDEWRGGEEALFIFLAIGKEPLQRFCELAPRGLKRIAFARGLRGDLTTRTYDFARFSRLCALKSPISSIA
jgi:hypothetical protein